MARGIRKRAEGLAMHGLLRGLSLAGRLLPEADLAGHAVRP